MKKLASLKGFNALTSEQLKHINGSGSTTISDAIFGDSKRKGGLCAPCRKGGDCISGACAIGWPQCEKYGGGKRCM